MMILNHKMVTHKKKNFC